MTRPTNGRRRKAQATRQAIIAATRIVMTSGNFRPSAKEIVAADGFAQRSIFDHFPTLEDLYRAAVADETTAHAMVSLMLRVTDERELALVLALGRIPGGR